LFARIISAQNAFCVCREENRRLLFRC